MSKVEKVSLFKYIDLVKSGVDEFQDTKKYISTGSLETGGIKDFEIVDYNSRPSRANMQFKENDIIFAKMKDTEKVFLIDDDTSKNIYSTGFAGLRINDYSKLMPKYVYYWLRSNNFQNLKNQNCSGATQKAINNTKLNYFMIPICDMDLQKQIVEELDNIGLLVEKRVESIKLLDNYLNSIFLKMFGNPISNIKNWEIMKFKDVGLLNRGKSKHRPRNAPELLGGIYPLIQTGDVSNSGNYIYKYSQTYSELGLKQSKMWKKGTLCITIAANIAKTGILTFDACFPDSVVGFLPNEKVNSEYVMFWISFLQKLLEETAPQVAQKNINLKILSNLDIPVPPIEIQNQFAVIVQQVEEIKKYQLESKIELENLFNNLMQKAFGCEVIC